MLACAWPEIYKPVAFEHGIPVMFHNEHGISEIAEMAQSGEQFFVIPGMQPDGRLIEYVSVRRPAPSRVGLRVEFVEPHLPPVSPWCDPG